MKLLKHMAMCLKARPFMMLLGRGDTDLTVLPGQFARWIGATEENGRYRQLQVPMDWMDSSDLFGHLNLEGKFIPGAIIDYLKMAQNDPEKPYILCLDQINLSRAEYYLREVLASVERKEPLVPVIYYGRDQQALERYGEVPALKNLYIIGTTNLDQASLPLNQKLLDRVYTLYLRNGNEPVGDLDATEKDNAFLQPEYENIGQDLSKAQEYFPLFEQFNKVLTEATSYMGYQLRNDAVLYLMNNHMLSRREAEDHMICQKVLTRLQGGKKLLPVLEKMQSLCAGSYPNAEAALVQMLRHCEEEGYTSFWS